jgi:hypothetical protein
VELDFSDTPDVQDFVTVPDGTYLCRVAEVQPGITRNGHDRWGIRLIVAEGEYVGRQAAWDSVVFTERGMIRARKVFEALGLPAAGRVNIEPGDLVGREALVVLRANVNENPDTGVRTRRTEVPYDGYRALPEGRTPPPPALADDDAIPF